MDSSISISKIFIDHLEKKKNKHYLSLNRIIPGFTNTNKLPLFKNANEICRVEYFLRLIKVNAKKKLH